MKLLILKTDLKTNRKINLLKPLLMDNPVIEAWNVDRNDIDNVLRIEATEQLKNDELIALLRSSGIQCEELND